MAQRIPLIRAALAGQAERVASGLTRFRPADPPGLHRFASWVRSLPDEDARLVRLGLVWWEVWDDDTTWELMAGFGRDTAPSGCPPGPAGFGWLLEEIFERAVALAVASLDADLEGMAGSA